MRNGDGKPIGKALDEYFRALGMTDKLYETKVLSRWEELMGKAVAARTTKLFIKEKTLVLEINSSVMRDELALHKKIIIEKINGAAQKVLIEDVYFK